MNILSFENLTKKYHTMKALDHVNWNVKKGEIHALLGHNGSGKTTSFLISNGIIPFDDGQVRIFNKELKTLTVKEKRCVSLLTEKLKLYKDLTVLDMINFYCDIYNVKKIDRHFSLLNELFEIGKYHKFIIKNLSTGMLKKVTIALTLINSPELAFLDEPFSGLDPFAIQQISNAIQLYNKENSTTFIISSHNLSEIENISHRVTIIKSGKICGSDSIKNLFDKHSLKRSFKIEFLKENEIQSLLVHDEKSLYLKLKEISNNNYTIKKILENKVSLADLYGAIYK